ncbi:unnamed protein product [Gordionus sp. m RMFG-2023]
MGNGIGLYVTKCIRKRRRITYSDLYYYYLTYIAWINLTISLCDACRIGENIRKFISNTEYSPNYAWLYFYTGCTLAIINGFFSASILILCLLLRDRFMNLHKPFRHKEICNSNMSDKIMANLGHLVGINTRNWRSTFVKLMPLILILISNVLSFSSYFWYDVIECSAISLNKYNPLNYYENFSGTSNRINYRNINGKNFCVKGVILPWSVTYDLIRVIIVLILPGFAILFYGFGVTYYVFKFMGKHRKTFPIDRKQISIEPLRSNNKIEITNSLGPIDLRPKFLTLATRYNITHGRAPMGNDETNQRSSILLLPHPWKECPSMPNLSKYRKKLPTKNLRKFWLATYQL